MKRILYTLLFSSLFIAGSVGAVTLFNVQQGGTGVGTFTSSNLLYGRGTNPVGTVATTTATCAGGTSCTAFTIIGSSPITITGASAGAAYPFTPGTFGPTLTSATSTAIRDIAGIIASSTSWFQDVNIIGATSSALAVTASSTVGGAFNSVSSNLLSSTTLFAKTLLVNATTTTLAVTGAGTSTFAGNVSVTGNLRVDGTFFSPVQIVSSGDATINGALIVTGTTKLATSLTGVLLASSGTVSNASVQTCTNQFVRAMSASYVATCATVGAADVSLANLTATNSTLTFSGTYDGSTARTIGLNLTNPNSWTGGQTFVSATTTGTQAIPNGSSQTPTIAGQIALDTTNGQLKVGDGSATIVFDQRRYYSFGYATSTWVGTTTLNLAPYIQAGTLQSMVCFTDTGTVGIDLQYNSTHLAYIPTASSTGNTFTWTTSNTPAAGNSSTVAIGTPASSPTRLGCTATFTNTGT